MPVTFEDHKKSSRLTSKSVNEWDKSVGHHTMSDSRKKMTMATHASIGLHGARDEPDFQHKLRRSRSSNGQARPEARNEPDFQHKLRRSQNPNISRHADVSEPLIQHKKRTFEQQTHNIESHSSVGEPHLQRKKRSHSASPPRHSTDDSAEPVLQHRKRPFSAVRNASNVFFTESSANATDDYVLLGDQSKFAPNVVYKVRSRNIPCELMRKEGVEQTESAARLSVPLARRVVVDTGKAHRRGQQQQVAGAPVSSTSVSASGNVRPSKAVAVSKSHSDTALVTPLAPRGRTRAPTLNTNSQQRTAAPTNASNQQRTAAPRVVVDSGATNASSQQRTAAPRVVDSGATNASSQQRTAVPRVVDSGATNASSHQHTAAPTNTSNQQRTAAPRVVVDSGATNASSQQRTAAPRVVVDSGATNATIDNGRSHTAVPQPAVRTDVTQTVNSQIAGVARTAAVNSRVNTAVNSVNVNTGVKRAVSTAGRPTGSVNEATTEQVEPLQLAHLTETTQSVHKGHLAPDNVNNSAADSNRKQTRKRQSTDTTQTNKTLQDKDEHCTSDYAVKYRVGLIPKRSSNAPKRTSEYQRQFQWRSFERNSPLMAAEQMVYKSHPDLTLLGPGEGQSSHTDSEYRSQYKHWQPEFNEQPTLVRSKSLKELSTADVQKKQHKVTVENQLTQQPVQSSKHDLSVAGNFGNFFPTRKMNSEYASQFKPPWKLLSRHIQQSDGVGVATDVRRPSVTDWYNEVLELRQHADEYRRRAHGTHFSRDHLAQLYARNAELWDTVSNASSVLSHSREQLRASVSSASLSDVDDEIQQESETDISPTTAAATASVAVAAETDTDVIASDEDVEDVNKPSIVHHHRTNTAHLPRNATTTRASDTECMSHTSSRGHTMSKSRQGHNSTSSQRHHRPRLSKGHQSRSHVDESYSQNVRDVIIQVPDTEQQQQQQHVRVNAGLPTRDSHVLVDATNKQLNTSAGCHDDSDVTLSTARSVESSCSLASQVLARARSRNEHFWT